MALFSNLRTGSPFTQARPKKPPVAPRTTTPQTVTAYTEPTTPTKPALTPQQPLPTQAITAYEEPAPPVTEPPVTGPAEPEVTTPGINVTPGTIGGVDTQEWWQTHAKNINGLEEQRQKIIDEFEKRKTTAEELFGGPDFWDTYWGKKTLQEFTEDRDAALAKVFDPAKAQPTVLYTDNGDPVALGFWVGNTFYVQKNLQELAGLKEGLGENEVPTLQDWMGEQGYEFTDVNESAAWQGLRDLIAKFNDPAQQQEWQQGGLNWAEQLLGLEPGQYGTSLKDILSQMDANRTRDPYELTSLQERDIAQRGINAREDTKLIFESLSASGRNIQALMAADEISSQIANQEIQSRLQYAEANFAKQEAEYAKLESQYQMMVQTGVMSATEYIQRQREHAGAQLAMYAQEVNMILDANANYLTQYQAELQGMEAHAQQIIQQIEVSLGTDERLIGQMQQYYEMALAPLRFQMEQAAFEAQMDAMDRESRNALWGNVLQLLGTGAGALLGNPAIFAGGGE